MTDRRNNDRFHTLAELLTYRRTMERLDRERREAERDPQPEPDPEVEANR
jgi:hypothetical protein